MMKPLKNLLILLSILLPLSAHAWGVVVSSGGVAAAGGGASISFVADSYDESNSTTVGFSVAMPTGTQEGDIMIAAVGHDIATDTWSLDGWTQIQETAIVSGGLHLTTFYKVAGSGEAGPYAFVADPGGNTVCQVIVATFRKTSGTWDIEASSEATIDNTTATITTTSITNTNDSVFLAFYANDGNITVSTAPAGLEVLSETTYSTTIALAGYYDIVTTGAATTATMVWSGNDESACHAICIDVVP